MSDELTALREEVAQLRAEVKHVRERLSKTMHLLGIVVWDGEWPKYLELEVASLHLRDPENDRSFPFRLVKNEKGGASMEFMDEKYVTRCEISAGKDGATLEIRNEDQTVILSLGEIQKGDVHLYVAKPDGKPAAGVQVKNGRGIVSVVDEKNRSLVLLHEGEIGGELLVANRNGQSAATLRASDKGGMITVHDPSGQVMGFLIGTSDQGLLSVNGPQGAMAVTLGAHEFGGMIVTNDEEGNKKAVFPPD